MIAALSQAALFFIAAFVITVGIHSLLGASGVAIVTLLAASFASCLWMWKRIPWATTDERYFSFGAVLLFACMASRLLYLADYLFLPERFDQWPLADESPEMSVLSAEAMTVLGTLLTVCAWWAAGGGRAQLSAAAGHENRKAYWVVYFISLVALATISADLFDASVLGQSAGVMVTGGLASSWFLNMDRSHGSLRRLAISLAMVFPFFWIALGYGMKEAIIFALLPAGVQAWLVFRSRIAKFLLVGVILAIAGWANSFVTFYRHVAWYSNTPISQAEALVEHASGDGFYHRGDLRRWDIAGFVMRANATYHRGWTVSLVELEGHKPEFVFEPLLYVFIPRLLWPEKPEINPGLEVTTMIFGFEDTKSSTAMGLYPAFYLGAGWIGVLAGACAAGILIALLTALARRIGGPVLLNLFAFAMAMVALRFDESWPVGVLSGPVITLLYLVMLHALMRMVGLAPSLVSARKHGSHRARL